jgi:hypothetical protein
MIIKTGLELHAVIRLSLKNPITFLCFFALVLAVVQASAEEIDVPDLGFQVPAYVLKARTHSKECLTSIARHDPCASVTIRSKRFMIAWDSETKAITYIFTKDPRFLTDSELGVGGLCRLSEPTEVVHYRGWLITPKWADTVRDLSGDAVWYAALRRTSAEYTQIVGFVQSRYLKLRR